MGLFSLSSEAMPSLGSKSSIFIWWLARWFRSASVSLGWCSATCIALCTAACVDSSRSTTSSSVGAAAHATDQVVVQAAACATGVHTSLICHHQMVTQNNNLLVLGDINALNNNLSGGAAEAGTRTVARISAHARVDAAVFAAIYIFLESKYVRTFVQRLMRCFAGQYALFANVDCSLAGYFLAVVPQISRKYKIVPINPLFSSLEDTTTTSLTALLRLL